MKRTLILFIALTIISFASAQTDAEYALGSDTIVPTQSIDQGHTLAFDTAYCDLYLRRIMRQNCNKVDTPIFFTDSEYIARLQALPYVVEMPFNAPVKQFIELYARRQRQVANMLGIGITYYFPLFEQTLEKYGVPLELCYLPVIESALNAKAVSPAGAGGLWQFMPATGRMYGLEVNSLVDERRDPVKATDAAARYLADLYKIYHDWHLVIAAYNCGPGNVSKAINRSGGKTDYWQIYPYLPRETRNYVPIFIAANYIMNYFSEHNICPARPASRYATDTIMIDHRVHFEQIASVLNIQIDELQFLNPQYRKDIIPGDIKSYPLVLPIEKVSLYDLNRDTILAVHPELTARRSVVEPAGATASNSYSGRVHKVKQGESLSIIARKYKTTVAALKKCNHLKSNMIHPGQKLTICK